MKPFVSFGRFFWGDHFHGTIVYSMNKEVILEIKKLYEKYLLRDASDFSVDDYNDFQEEVWGLRNRFDYDDSPFLLLPDPAKDADYFMMNASGDGLMEPSLQDKKKYIAMMKESYDKLCDGRGV